MHAQENPTRKHDPGREFAYKRLIMDGESGFSCFSTVSFYLQKSRISPIQELFFVEFFAICKFTSVTKEQRPHTPEQNDVVEPLETSVR